MTSAPDTGTSPPERAWVGVEQAYADTYRRLLRLAYVLTGSGPAAEDVVHDVFVSAGPRIATLEAPEPYLRASVVNRCRSLHRRQVRAPLPDRAQQAHLEVELIELRDALAQLSDRQRCAIVLRYLCDLPDQEIAEVLDCRRATVRSLVQRGLSELREVIR